MKLTALSLLVCLPVFSAEKPNIIVFLADDLGYNEISANGQKRFQTPNIDQIAKDGVRFTQFYSGHAVCAASRCSLLTGKHSGHSYVRENSEGVDFPEKERIKTEDGFFAQLPIPASEVTIAEVLKGAGYRTACIGKWGLGHPSNEGSPNRQGFDLFYGYISQWQAHNHYPTYLWRNDKKETLPGNDGRSLHGGTYAADVMEKEALDFISGAKDQPFFLYFATPVPHVALQVPGDEPSLPGFKEAYAEDPDYDGKRGYLPTSHPRATYAAMVTRMDRTLGRMRELLKRTGRSENTLIIFTSDNGATFNGGYDREFFGGNLPLRGGKAQLWDGGIRVPCVAAWPGKIPAGRTSDFIGANWDLFPTLTQTAGAEAPENLDGVSILPTLTESGRQTNRDHLYWETVAGGSQAIRFGEWKAIRMGAAKNANAPVQLFHISADIGESRDVAAEHPDLVAKASEIFRTGRTPSQYFPFPALDMPR